MVNTLRRFGGHGIRGSATSRGAMSRIRSDVDPVSLAPFRHAAAVFHLLSSDGDRDVMAASHIDSEIETDAVRCRAVWGFSQACQGGLGAHRSSCKGSGLQRPAGLLTIAVDRAVRKFVAGGNFKNCRHLRATVAAPPRLGYTRLAVELSQPTPTLAVPSPTIAATSRTAIFGCGGRRRAAFCQAFGVAGQAILRGLSFGGGV